MGVEGTKESGKKGIQRLKVEKKKGDNQGRKTWKEGRARKEGGRDERVRGLGNWTEKKKEFDNNSFCVLLFFQLCHFANHHELP